MLPTGYTVCAPLFFIMVSLFLQVAYQNDPEGALIQFASPDEAKHAMQSTEAVLNNRFIKVHWFRDDGSDGHSQGQSHLQQQPQPQPPMVNTHFKMSFVACGYGGKMFCFSTSKKCKGDPTKLTVLTIVAVNVAFLRTFCTLLVYCNVVDSQPHITNILFHVVCFIQFQ